MRVASYAVRIGDCGGLLSLLSLVLRERATVRWLCCKKIDDDGSLAGSGMRPSAPRSRDGVRTLQTHSRHAYRERSVSGTCEVRRCETH